MESISRELYDVLEEIERRRKYNKLKYILPLEGPFNRFKYKHALDFFEAGAKYRQRLFCAANRVGKTYTCAIEVALHLTGRYDLYGTDDNAWKGRVFKEPIRAWAVGLTHGKVRQSIQIELLGPFNDIGSGLIPKEDITKVVMKNGNPECVGAVYVKHYTNGIHDGESLLEFMAYDQGPDAFQATSIHVVWMDEEPDNPAIHTECATRTMKTSTFPGGILILSFTPWKGATATVMRFLPNAVVPVDHVVPETDTWAINVGWDDVPHLDEDEKEALKKKYPSWEVGARSKGIISVGMGQVYPIPEADYVVDPFEIPSWWPKVWAMDVGFQCTAVIWFAQNPNTGTWYIYDEHYSHRMEPPLHAAAILARGKWIPGVTDPAANRGNTRDGATLLREYRELGLNVRMANNAIRTGIHKVWSMLINGQLKVFRTCTNVIRERRMYHVDETGKIPDKQDDHAMDAERYGVNSGLVLAIPEPDPDDDPSYPYRIGTRASSGVNPATGY